MMNLIIAYDDNDSSLAEYFESSYQYVLDFTDTSVIITNYPIPGLNCTESHITDTVNSLNGLKFCFVGFSHGNDNSLLTDNGVYVSSSTCPLFNESVFYSTGCQTALKLGPELIDNGCSAFVGYYDDSWVTFEQFNNIYIDCENYALKLFLTTDISLGDAFDLMMDKYDSEIMNMYNSNEILMAMELLHNRDCMGILGNEDIRSADLHC